MKRLLILLLFALPVSAQTNTFCASNLSCTVSGQWSLNAVKTQNSIQFADQYAAGPLVMAAPAPGIGNLSTGGSVAANNYKCEITFVGSAGGETTPSPASLSTTTGGATSQLECQALFPVPTGAVSYNVYWQTGGAGSFFLGHTGVVLSAGDLQSTTPATSGTTPPITNTATSPLAAAQSASTGVTYIPSSVGAPYTAGVAGGLSPNQSIHDFRNGTISSRVQYPGAIQPGAESASANSGWSLDFLVPNQIGNLEQVTGLNVIVHAENAGQFGYWGGINGNPGIAAFQMASLRTGTRTEPLWLEVGQASCNNSLGICRGSEMDIINNGVASQTPNGGIGYFAAAGGTANTYIGYDVGQVSSSQWQIGYRCQPNSYTTNCLVIGSTTSGGAFGLFSNQPNGSLVNGNFWTAQTPSTGQNAILEFQDNTTAKFDVGKDTANDFTINDLAQGKLRFQANAGANGANVYQTPGTGQHSFNNPLQVAEIAAPSGSASNDVLYGDSTLHALKLSNNNGTFFQVAQVIVATSSAFATATTAGTCVQNTTAVAGAATTMAVSISPVSTPGVGAVWSAFVSSAGNVTINECAVATSAGGTIAFNIRVIP